MRLALAFCVLASGVWAEPPEVSPHPVARPVVPAIDTIDTIDTNGAQARAETLLPDASPLAVPFSVQPPARPDGIVAMAQRSATERARGTICGDPAIQGDVLGDVPGRGQCGVTGAVRVRSVAGITLSTPATMDCRTATALKTWVRTGAIPAVGDEGGGVASLRVIGDYACRGRNNVAGARLSEHAYGRAIDIAGIGLRDGSEITVLTGWDTAADGAQLRRMHTAACGPFGTVLGPDVNAAHRDHFHFDTARYRSGSYCR